ncbi:MAG: hypothetical protein K6F35_00195 [Lachnospiraceae bacterium]|nr:hypothetical protein [Lachnospiraceae bacterium]
MKHKSIQNAYMWFYPLSVLAYLLTPLSEMVRPGLILTGMLLALLIIMAGSARIACHKTEDIVFCVFFAYSLLSGIWTTAYGIPVSVYLGEVSTTVLPMIFYLSGRKAEKEDILAFYRIFLFSMAVLAAVSLLLYIFVPQFYIDFLVRASLISKGDAATARVRMESVVGSTLFGTMMAYAAGSSIYFIERDSKKSRIFGAASFFLFLIMAFFSSQRAAMVVALFMLLLLNFIVFFRCRILPAKLFMAECGALLLGLIALALAGRDAFLKVYYRLRSLPLAVGERSEQWVGAVNNMKNMWLGDGLGSHGHRAAGYAEHVVADGGLVKLYCEAGIIGTSFFIFFMLLILRKGYRNLERTGAEMAVITGALLLSIGSNVLTFELAVPIVFFAAGRAVSVNTGEAP